MSNSQSTAGRRMAFRVALLTLGVLALLWVLATRAQGSGVSASVTWLGVLILLGGGLLYAWILGTLFPGGDPSLVGLFDMLPVGVAILDPKGRMLRCNEVGLTLLGMTEEAVKALDWTDPSIPILQVDGNSMEREQMPVNQALQTLQCSTGIIGIERPTDGNWAWLSLSVEPRLGTRGGIKELICVFEDVTQRKTTEAELAIQTFRDRLTSLPNRTLFMERCTQSILRSDRHKLGTAVLFLDLDRFKVVNDSLSHEAGDQLLVQLAKRIRAVMRPEDTVARWGGDEFVVLFEDVPNVSDGLRVAERIRDACRTAFLLHGQEVYATCSMGIAISMSSETVPSELVRDAEVAMYRAKAKGEAAIEIFDPSMNAQALVRFQMERDLRRGLERKEFLLYYQPLISFKTGSIEGWEALVRWQHPEKGMVSPMDFIPVAEETGLIAPLGQWVLEEAIRQAAEWEQQFPCDPPRLMNVNISGRQFQQKDLVATVLDTLAVCHFDPKCLKLEITESVMMRDPQASLEAMRVFRGQEIHLVIDDFGTGYSSLSYLKRFPVDTLKVDKSFVDGLGTDTESSAIVQAVISLAKSLGMRVTAEGIETAEQLDWLWVLDCDQGQGYFFSRPLSAAAARELLEKNPKWF